MLRHTSFDRETTSSSPALSKRSGKSFIREGGKNSNDLFEFGTRVPAVWMSSLRHGQLEVVDSWSVIHFAKA